VSSSDPFAPTPLFAFPLFSSVVAGHEAHKEALAAEILELKSRSPGTQRSNRQGWHSGPEFLNSRSEAIAFVLKSVSTFARRALAPYYHDWTRSELKLGHYWANVLGKGGWNSPHHHHPQHWSGVYYVSVGPVGTTAEDPSGMIEFLNPSPVQSHWGAGSFAYGPRDGLTLLFPSSLVHLVHPHSGDHERISIAYNFNVIPKKP
jgi:uncharacterized protein (TIGR02466 family)